MVMDVNTGEIFAMVSLPDFDPYHPGDAPTRRNSTAPARRVRNGLDLQAVLDGGGAGQRQGEFHSSFDAPDPINRPLHHQRLSPENRALSVPEIFIYSSNVGTAKMAISIGEDGLQNFYRKMGFITQAPLEMPERGRPIYP